VVDGYSTLRALNELETQNERPKDCIITGCGVVVGQSMETLAIGN
jgi:hypothetical protein